MTRILFLCGILFFFVESAKGQTWYDRIYGYSECSTSFYNYGVKTTAKLLAGLPIVGEVISEHFLYQHLHWWCYCKRVRTVTYYYGLEEGVISTCVVCTFGAYVYRMGTSAPWCDKVNEFVPCEQLEICGLVYCRQDIP